MTTGEDFWQLLQAVGAVATAVGVALAAAQLWSQKRQQRTDFEDRLSEQYREIMAQLPYESLLEDRALEGKQRRRALLAFYRYFDLTNEQIFLFKKQRRISRSTWKNWEEGIRSNMRRKAFREAWSEIAARMPDSFDELRKVERPQPRAVVAEPRRNVVTRPPNASKDAAREGVLA